MTLTPGEILPFLLPAIAAATWVTLPLYAARQRGRRYATFAAVLLTLSVPGALLGHARGVALVPAAWLPLWHVAFAYAMAAAALHLSHLVNARMRSAPFRALVSVPGQAFIAGGFMTLGWHLLLLPVRVPLLVLDQDGALHVMRWLELVPWVAAAVAAFTSPRPVVEWVRVRLGESGPDRVSRVPVERHRRPPEPLSGDTLRLVQIADPHIGPWQSVARLQRTVARLLAHDPHMVLLTGDFLTMESNGSPDALAEALRPLRDFDGPRYAIFGNHDHEAPDEVRFGLEESGVTLLVDEEAVATTRAGPVQIIGSDYMRKDRAERLKALLAQHPPRAEHLRLLLLHDPSAFHDVPPGDVDLVLSGHTHGGQVGLVSFGLDWTVLSRSRWPDHGLFALGASRLYVHRGTGFYGFPLRVGVPGEASVMEVVR